MLQIQDFPDTGNFGVSGFSKVEQIWSLFHLNHPMAFLLSQHILQRLHENTRNWYFLEEMCETIIVKLSNLDGQGDVDSRLRACQEARAKWKQRWLQLQSVLMNDLVSNHKLKILGNQTEAKNVHNFGAEKTQHTHIAPGTKKQAKNPNPKPKNTYQWLQVDIVL